MESTKAAKTEAMDPMGTTMEEMAMAIAQLIGKMALTLASFTPSLEATFRQRTIRVKRILINSTCQKKFKTIIFPKM